MNVHAFARLVAVVVPRRRVERLTATLTFGCGGELSTPCEVRYVEWLGRPWRMRASCPQTVEQAREVR